MSVLRWLLIIELLGLTSWPLCFILFRSLADGGLGLSRLVGMLLLSYAAWLFASTGLFPYDAASIVSLLVLYGVAAAFIYGRNRAEINEFIRERRRILLFEQIFFLAVFFAAVAIQAYKPDVTLAEKQPDLMFIRAMLAGRGFPPQDLWFSGAPVNYYYLGYVVFATVVRLAAVRPEVGFNLAVATVVPLACLGAFSLAYNITRKRGWSLLAPLALLGAGNLDAVVRVVRRGGLAGTNWFNEMFSHGSREVIPGTIHEFPCFSFLLGDLHPHYMFMPFCFLFLSALFLFFVKRKDIFPDFRPGPWVPHGLFFALVLGSAYMFHTWDYPAYMVLTLLAVAALCIRYGKGRRPWGFLAWILFLLLLSALYFLPFRLTFRPPARLALRLVDPGMRSPLGGFVTVNGLALFALFSFLLAGLRFHLAAGTLRLRSSAVAGVSAALVAGSWILTGTVAAGLAASAAFWAAVLILSGEETPGRLFLAVIGLLCAAILLGCEFVYLKDFYGARLQRQNTVFKFYYQVWILSSLLVSAGGACVMERLKGAARYAWAVALSLLIASCLIYPLAGTYDRCQGFRGGRGARTPYLPTLDGTAFIKAHYRDDYDALRWIEENIGENEVILEASGEPFSFYGRVSAFTGRPTVLGWANHESLWRDWSWKSTMERMREVEQMYNAENKLSVKPLLDRYGVDYVYVGPLERRKYRSAGLAAFGKYMPRVYRGGTVSIYKVPRR